MTAAPPRCGDKTEIVEVGHFSLGSCSNDASGIAAESIKFQSIISPGPEALFIQSKFWIELILLFICLFDWFFFNFTQTEMHIVWHYLGFKKESFQYKFFFIKIQFKNTLRIELKREAGLVHQIDSWQQCLITPFTLQSHTLWSRLGSSQISCTCFAWGDRSRLVLGKLLRLVWNMVNLPDAAVGLMSYIHY